MKCQEYVDDSNLIRNTTYKNVVLVLVMKDQCLGHKNINVIYNDLMSISKSYISLGN